MLKNYTKELTSIVIAFGLISYAVYVCAAEPVKTKPVVVTAPKPVKEVKKPVAKEVKKPAGKEVTTPDPKKDPNRKKPTLKAKYADKK
jgi:uncharacterized membrane protein